MEEISFLTEIGKEASRQEQAILKKAEEPCRKILEEARREADRLEAAWVHRTNLEIRKHRSRLLTQAGLEKRYHLLNLKSRFVSKTLEAAQAQFDALTPRETRSVLKKFLSELVKSLEGNKKVVLRVNPQDEKVAQTLLGELHLSAEVRTDPSISRGLELEDEEENLRVRNTFDSRLRQAHEEMIQQLNKILFKGIDV